MFTSRYSALCKSTISFYHCEKLLTIHESTEVFEHSKVDFIVSCTSWHVCRWVGSWISTDQYWLVWMAELLSHQPLLCVACRSCVVAKTEKKDDIDNEIIEVKTQMWKGRSRNSLVRHEYWLAWWTKILLSERGWRRQHETELRIILTTYTLHMSHW